MYIYIYISPRILPRKYGCFKFASLRLLPTDVEKKLRFPARFGRPGPAPSESSRRGCKVLMTRIDCLKEEREVRCENAESTGRGTVVHINEFSPQNFFVNSAVGRNYIFEIREDDSRESPCARIWLRIGVCVISV